MEYIERDAALESVREKLLITDALPAGIPKDASTFTLASMQHSLESIPAADVRPVVLCSDCKYWKQWDNTTHYLCTYVAGAKFIRNADDFCSRGEKGES